MQLHKVLYCVLAMSDQNMSLISSPGRQREEVGVGGHI